MGAKGYRAIPSDREKSLEAAIQKREQKLKAK